MYDILKTNSAQTRRANLEQRVLDLEIQISVRSLVLEHLTLKYVSNDDIVRKLAEVQCFQEDLWEVQQNIQDIEASQAAAILPSPEMISILSSGQSHLVAA